MKKTTVVRKHQRNTTKGKIWVKRHLRKMTPRQRKERLTVARLEGIKAEKMMEIYFRRRGLNVINISTSTAGAGDLLVFDATGKKWIIEVKKINEWEQTGVGRRRGRIQINKYEHKMLLEHAISENATPIYITVIQYESGLTGLKYLSPKKITNYLEGKKYTEVKVPFALIESEEFSFEKFR